MLRLSLRAALAALLCMSGAACGALGPHKISQLYYLGVFDPTEQVPATVYRVRVLGKSDSLSTTNYAAGWVPSKFVDSLGTSLSFDADTRKLQFDRGAEGFDEVQLATGRRMMLFGPEGFREAPTDHRLAVVMSNDPSEFFEAIDSALGQLSAAKALESTSSPAVRAQVSDAIFEVQRDQQALEALSTELGGEE